MAGTYLATPPAEMVVARPRGSWQLRAAVHSIFVGFLTVLGGAFLALTSTITTAVTLAATALIVPGTGEPNPGAIGGLEENAVKYYVVPNTADYTASCPASSCNPVGIPYIAQFWPFPIPGWGGLSGSKWDVSVASGLTNLQKELAVLHSNPPAGDITIFGYSQGAAVASMEKTALAGLTPAEKANYSFVLIGNPERPNGGVFERLAALGTVPILDATFGLPTPTDTGIQTTDIAFQYDGVADFPEYPINLLADLNALAGFAYIHPTYLAPNEGSSQLPDGYTEEELLAAQADPANQVQVGDTLYITIPTKTLPILDPLIAVGQATGTSALVNPVVDLISPTLRVLIDTGYDPNANPGVPTPFRLIPPVNPVTLASDLVTAAVQGVQAVQGDLATGPVDKQPVPLIPPIVTVTRPSVTQDAVPTSASTASTTLKATVPTAKAAPRAKAAAATADTVATPTPVAKTKQPKASDPLRSALHRLTSSLTKPATSKEPQHQPPSKPAASD
ncbi:MAG: PE-PPE domain-containing protein [Mycobacterium sp.]